MTSGELAQLARAPALHAGGQGFDSLILHDLWIYSFLYLIKDFKFREEASLTFTIKTSQRENRALSSAE